MNTVDNANLKEIMEILADTNATNDHAMKIKEWHDKEVNRLLMSALEFSTSYPSPEDINPFK